VSICVRCEKPEPSPMTLGSGWLLILDELGRDQAMVCPECQSADERADVVAWLAEGGRAPNRRRLDLSGFLLAFLDLVPLGSTRVGDREPKRREPWTQSRRGVSHRDTLQALLIERTFRESGGEVCTPKV
jgi:hypothetical protein